MMNIYLTITILLANLIAIAIVYQFIKKLDKKQVVMFIGISVGITYILISIVYWLSGFGVDKEIHQASKNFVLYLFVPVNVILIIPYFAAQYMKLKSKKIKREKFANKITVLAIILLISLIIEFIIFRNIQKNIKTILITNQKEITGNVLVEKEQNIENTEIINDDDIENISQEETTDGQGGYYTKSNENIQNEKIETRTNNKID